MSAASVRRVDDGDRERSILEAAAELFRQKGFHGAGMDEIGALAGLSGPALYRTFGGKNEILAALFTEALDELAGATAVLDADPVVDLRRLVHHHVLFTVERRALVAVYQREDKALVDPWRREFDRRRRRYVERWEAAISRAVPDDTDVSVATQLVLGSIFSMASWPSRTLQTPDAVGAIEAFVLRGVGLVPASG